MNVARFAKFHRKKESGILHKTIQKKHLITTNKKKTKDNRSSKFDKDNDEDEAPTEEIIHDDEPSRYSSFKKKSEKR